LNILLANDDGIHAPGLKALRIALESLGRVTVVAPATEQSGVGHSITYLSPLTCKQIFDAEIFRGWAVDGSPADCVKLGLTELAPKPTELKLALDYLAKGEEAKSREQFALAMFNLNAFLYVN